MLAWVEALPAGHPPPSALALSTTFGAGVKQLENSPPLFKPPV